MHLYSFAMRMYAAAAYILAITGNEKAKQWHKGRKNWRQKLRDIPFKGRVFWFHCASLGEYEQGLPIMNFVKHHHPDCFIFVTFFSPSGYLNHKKNTITDAAAYLPIDSPGNAREFMDIVNPEAAIFIKYEFWIGYIHECDARNCPLIIASGIFRKNQFFFKSWASAYLKQLRKVDHFFVQNPESRDILNHHGFENVTLAGDTRFDRVAETASRLEKFPKVEEFLGDKKTLILGSSWPEEESYLIEFIARGKLKGRNAIIAPHEISRQNIRRLRGKLGDKTALLSELEIAGTKPGMVLIIDTIGALKYLYRFADIAVVGGGFNAGIHNILEAAVFHIPVLFGPEHRNFPEALEMIENKTGFSFKNYNEFESLLTRLIENPEEREMIGIRAEKYMRSKTGAVPVIGNYILKRVRSSKKAEN